MNEEATARHFRVSGRVQGVHFRRSAQREAERLGLCGWVANHIDGSVEAYAFGTVAAVRAFERWLQQGPPHARVTRVESSDAEREDHHGFIVR